MQLTIAIPSLQSRAAKARELLDDLYGQIVKENACEAVEVLYLPDKGERSIGYKRNWCLDHARGEFFCFVDDDDRVHAEYVKLILTGIRQNPEIDCVGITGIYHNINRGTKQNFVHSVKYHHYFERAGLLCRPPNHLNPIRLEKIKPFRFPDRSFGEDTDWAMRVCRARVLKNEHMIRTPIYFYDYLDNKPPKT